MPRAREASGPTSAPARERTTSLGGYEDTHGYPDSRCVRILAAVSEESVLRPAARAPLALA